MSEEPKQKSKPIFIFPPDWETKNENQGFILPIDRGGGSGTGTNSEDSKNIRILRDIAVRNDYRNGRSSWFASEYLASASQRNGGWTPLFAISSVLALWLLLGSEIFSIYIFWAFIFLSVFGVFCVVCMKINAFLEDVVFQMPHFWTIAFWTGATWVLYHVIKYYLRNWSLI